MIKPKTAEEWAKDLANEIADHSDTRKELWPGDQWVRFAIRTTLCAYAAQERETIIAAIRALSGNKKEARDE